MNEHLAFAQCLQRVLNETELTATEVARRLEMRSRNSIFRILKGKTSPQLNRRFLESFHKHMGGAADGGAVGGAESCAGDGCCRSGRVQEPSGADAARRRIQ